MQMVSVLCMPVLSTIDVNVRSQPVYWQIKLSIALIDEKHESDAYLTFMGKFKKRQRSKKGWPPTMTKRKVLLNFKSGDQNPLKKTELIPKILMSRNKIKNK